MNILQIKKDRDNGAIISRATINEMIDKLVEIDKENHWCGTCEREVEHRCGDSACSASHNPNELRKDT